MLQVLDRMGKLTKAHVATVTEKTTRSVRLAVVIEIKPQLTTACLPHSLVPEMGQMALTDTTFTTLQGEIRIVPFLPKLLVLLEGGVRWGVSKVVMLSMK